MATLPHLSSFVELLRYPAYHRKIFLPFAILSLILSSFTNQLESQLSLAVFTSHYSKLWTCHLLVIFNTVVVISALPLNSFNPVL